MKERRGRLAIVLAVIAAVTICMTLAGTVDADDIFQRPASGCVNGQCPIQLNSGAVIRTANQTTAVESPPGECPGGVCAVRPEPRPIVVHHSPLIHSGFHSGPVIVHRSCPPCYRQPCRGPQCSPCPNGRCVTSIQPIPVYRGVRFSTSFGFVRRY